MTVEVFTESRSGGLGKAADGTYEVILITPGQGSSGYYSESMIAAHAAEAFPKGSHSYLDHTETRSPEKLIGVLVEDTRIHEDGSARNRFKPMPHWAAFVEAVAPYCGLSISASGEASKGEIDGRETNIVESLIPSITNTVDLVSYAGRGGGFAENLLESAIAASTNVQSANSASGKQEKENEMAFDEAKADRLLAAVEALVEAQTKAETARIAAEEAANAANKDEPTVADIVAAVSAVESAEVSESLKTSLLQGITEGHLDVASKLAEHKTLRDEIAAELRESAIVGAGGSGSGTVDATVKGW